MTDDSYLYALVSVSESVLVKFSTLYLVSKVLEKSGIGPPLFLMSKNQLLQMLALSWSCSHYYSVIGNNIVLYSTKRACSSMTTFSS